ncbi:MAG: 1-acyl-sn-glycerol-3-phosphate acyltransferase [Spirochaetales bacterium]|nr:1-acyl-sn-glycerol-3-phosphate acyltransferase [Spirochaetales bacterium]
MVTLLTPERVLLVLRALVTGSLAIRVDGLEHIPERGGAILVCNHSDYADPLIQALFSGRRLTFLGKAGMLELQWLRRLQSLLSSVDKSTIEGGLVELADEFLNISGQVLFDIQQSLTPAEDPLSQEELDKLCQILRDGAILALYPEMKSSPGAGLAPFSDLPVQLSRLTGLPVVPAGIIGSHGLSSLRQWLFGRNIGRAVVYSIGEPMLFVPAEDISTGVQKLHGQVARLCRRQSSRASM